MRTLAILVTALALAIMVGAQDKKQTSPQDLQRSLDDVQQKRDELQKRLNRVKSQSKAVKRDIRSVDYDLTRVASALDRTTDKLDQSVARKDQLAGELSIASARLTDQKARVENRLRQMYRQPDHNVLTLLAGSESVGDFAERKALLERIAERDRDTFEEFKQLKADIQAKKREEEGLIAQISDLKSQQEGRQDELQSVQDEKKQVLRTLEGQRRELEREFAEFDRQSKILEARIRDYQRSRMGTAGALKFSGVMVKPASGPYTSSFGNRYHPILKRYRPHNGVDIGAPNRSAIKAAASGTVITAGWMNGYGNTVAIDHGDGISTLYGHCSALYVSAGQNVVAGDRIAAVGSTGLATGPHLHFEVRVNGAPVNPVRYLP